MGIPFLASAWPGLGGGGFPTPGALSPSACHPDKARGCCHCGLGAARPSVFERSGCCGVRGPPGSPTPSVAGDTGEDLRPLLALFSPSGRWFDVLQKVSTQLKTNLTSATKNRADKVSERRRCRARGRTELGTSQVGCLKCSVED